MALFFWLDVSSVVFTHLLRFLCTAVVQSHAYVMIFLKPVFFSFKNTPYLQMYAPPAALELNCVPEQHFRRRRRRRKVKDWAIALRECGVSDGMHTAGRETQARLFIRISFLPRQDIELAVFLLGFMASLYPRFMKMYLLHKMLFFCALFSWVVSDRKAPTRTPPFRYVFQTWPVPPRNRSTLSRSGLTHFTDLDPKLFCFVISHKVDDKHQDDGWWGIRDY